MTLPLLDLVPLPGNDDEDEDMEFMNICDNNEMAGPPPLFVVEMWLSFVSPPAPHPVNKLDKESVVTKSIDGDNTLVSR